MEIDRTKILVVEDDFQNRQLINIYLSRSGYEVVSAINGTAALDKLQNYTPDLIVSDIAMPFMDGFELYDKVKGFPHLRSVPFIFLTAYSDTEKRRHSKEIGSDDFLTKPIEQEELLASIRGKLKRVNEIKASTQTEILNQVDQLKREILSTITHEVNTPLFIIKLTSNLLLDEKMDFHQDELQELLLRIKRSGERLDSLLKDFLVTVRVATGEAKNEFEKTKQDVDLNFIIQHLLPRFDNDAKIRNISLTSHFTPNMPSLSLDVDQIADVMERLIGNAIKFNKENGFVKINTSHDKEKIVIVIEDSGIGISADNIPLIFNKFFQVNRGEMEQQGAGLGLNIARDLSRINGGEITVISEEGVGSKFILTFLI
ncbi:hybrid sensor histidine kinase/response regulator [bacterium]|nr:hybrid sensor histidine kinase/response regulator [bacterium]